MPAAPSPASSRTRAGRARPPNANLARGMGPLQRRGRQGTGQLRAADSLFHTGIHREDIDQAGDSQDTEESLSLTARSFYGGVSPVELYATTHETAIALHVRPGTGCFIGPHP